MSLDRDASQGSVRFVPRLEGLEDRTVPAGNVQAMVGDGILYVGGDDLANQIWIAGAGRNSVVIRSLDGTTTINGQTEPLFIGGINRGYHIEMNGGDDVLIISGTRSNGLLNVNMGEGNNVLGITDAGHRKETIITTGNGNDIINLHSSAFRRPVYINTGFGDDVVNADGVGSLDFWLVSGGGSNFFNSQNSTIPRPMVMGFTFSAPPQDPDASVAPTVALTTTAPDPTNQQTLTFAAAFDKPVSGFSEAGVSVINGSVTSFTALDAQTYTFQVAPTSEGIVSVTVLSGAAFDVFGNANLPSQTVLRTYDITAPLITITPLTTNSSLPTITGTVDDPNATVSVTVNGQTIAATVTGSTWAATLTNPLTDGAYSVMATATDAAGNSRSATSPSGLIIDATPPTINFSADPGQSTKTDLVTVMLQFSENVIITQPVTGSNINTISVGNITNSNDLNFQKINDSTYTIDLMIDLPGNVTVTVANGLAIDMAGNLSEGNSFTIIYDITDPTGTIDPSGKSKITGTAADALSGVESVAISIFNGSNYYTGPFNGFDSPSEQFLPVATANNFANWSFEMPLTGTFTVRALITDRAGNETIITQSVTVTDAPVATITADQNDPTNAQAIRITVEFDEEVTGFEAYDLDANITNGTSSSFNIDEAGLRYSFDITPANDGTVTFTLTAGAVENLNNAPNAETIFTIVSDQTDPLVDIDVIPTDTGIITGTAEDNLTGVVSVVVSVFDPNLGQYLQEDGSFDDDEVFLAATDTATGGDPAFTTWSLIAPAGIYNVSARATDAAGNEGETSSDGIEVS